MRSTVKLPKVGETVDEVLVISWERAVGDHVDEGDIIMRVETAKVDAEVPSPVGGTIVELLVEEEVEIATGAPICVIEHDT